MSEFQSQEDVWRAYLRGIVQTQIDENPSVVHNFLQLHHQDNAQIYQVFQQYSPSSQYSEESMALDSMEVTDSQAYFDEQQPEKVREKEYVGESDDEDPDEFKTHEEAQKYAIEVSLELFEEIVSEFIAEQGAYGVLDIDNTRRQEICWSEILPDVWQAMGGK